jgi:maltooligosyltrehalose synthase
VIVPRLVVGLLEGQEKLPLGSEVWDDTHLTLDGLPAGRYVDQLTGATHDVSAGVANPTLQVGGILRDFPVALLAQVHG